MKAEYTDVNSYISSFDQDTQQILTKIRNIIKTSAPEAEESISYGMPAYKTFKKPLIYFAAFKSHIGFYATPSGHGHFAQQLSSYKQGKGSVQFPVNQPIPYQLIEEIVLFRVQENKTKYAK